MAEPTDGYPTSPSSKIPAWLGVPVCLFFIFSILVWFSLDSITAKTIYYIVFFLPDCICGEYLWSLIFSRASGLSISQAGFSPLRILIGVCVAFALLALIYGSVLVVRLVIV